MIPEIADLLKTSIEECLEEEVAISFSGGLDSSLIASIAGKCSFPHLFSSGIENSEDIVYSEEVSKILKLPYEKIILDESEILKLYSEIYRIIPTELLKIEILIPIYASAKAASKKNFSVMLLGSGAEELFVGYNRYYAYFEEGKDLDSILKEEFRTLKKRDVNLISKIVRKAGLEPRFPFLNEELAKYVFSIPLEKRIEDRELKKGLLREASKLLGLADIVIKRKKKAAQYGSGVHKVLIKNSDYINENYPPKI
ncbi:MAG: asparagine synthase C-terminal domain-containing protein [Candidatus ainarchaeum sp.]|nr:asparagine synthase C-terminal domain-containing protein [Candidatus ainarchaeum sp.]